MKILQKLSSNHSPLPKSQPESSKTTDETPCCQNHTAAVEHHHQDPRKFAKQDTFCKKKVHEIKTVTHDEFYLNSENNMEKEGNCKQPGSQHHHDSNPSDLHSTS